MKLLTAAFLLASALTPAVSEEVEVSYRAFSNTSGASGNAFVIEGKSEGPVATLGLSGCIRGPFRFEWKNTIYLDLTEGADYPAGCSSKQTQQDTK